MKVVLFNAPPKSGKDTIANALINRVKLARKTENFPIEKLEIKDTLRGMACLLTQASADHYDVTKDIPLELIKGQSLRELMIAMSEEFVKPRYGHDFWVRRTIADMWQGGLYLVTDMGFQVELNTVVKEVGAENVIVVHVHRPNTSFKGDSRNWVSTPHGIPVLVIVNNSTVEDATDQLQDFLIAKGFLPNKD